MNEELFDKRFNYDPLTGELYYKRGKVAGWISAEGYRKVRAYGKVYFVHRLIFWRLHGYWPNIVDHINRIKSDNRIENLRDVSAQENTWNQNIRSTNKSGIKNVFWHKASNKFLFVVMRDGVSKTLARFKTIEEAKQYFHEIDQ